MAKKKTAPSKPDEQLEVRKGLPKDALYQQDRLLADITGKPAPKKPLDKPFKPHELHHLVREIVRLQGELFMIAQAILDAQAKLDAAVAANSAKIDALIAATTGSASPAEQQMIADAIAASAAAVEANNAKS